MGSGNQNTRKWKKGESGNPSGRPKSIISQDIKLKWAQVDPTDKEKRTFGEQVLHMLFYKAGREGSVKAAETLLEHGWGKPVQAVDLSATLRGDSADNMEFIWSVLAGIDAENKGTVN